MRKYLLFSSSCWCNERLTRWITEKQNRLFDVSNLDEIDFVVTFERKRKAVFTKENLSEFLTKKVKTFNNERTFKNDDISIDNEKSSKNLQNAINNNEDETINYDIVHENEIVNAENEQNELKSTLSTKFVLCK